MSTATVIDLTKFRQLEIMSHVTGKEVKGLNDSVLSLLFYGDNSTHDSTLRITKSQLESLIREACTIMEAHVSFVEEEKRRG